MILLDTHIWIWWVDENTQLSDVYRKYLDANKDQGIAISIMSCWEVAKLVQKNRLVLARPVLGWIRVALSYPGVALLELTPEIVVASTQLPDVFHKDPVDQILVATSRVHDLPLMSADSRICQYPHVRLWKSDE